MQHLLNHDYFWKISPVLALIILTIVFYLLIRKLVQRQFKEIETLQKSLLNERQKEEEHFFLNISHDIKEKIIKEFSSHGLSTEKSFFQFSTEFQSKLSESVEKNLKSQRSFQSDFSESLRRDFEKLNLMMDQKIHQLSTRVQENLDEGFKKTNQTFQSVMERLTRIDEAQKKIEQLSSDVVSLQDVLTDKKTRGIFGEVQLNQILNNVFGEPNKKTYALQYKLENGTIVDSILFLPEPTGAVPIDSKFPLENYRRQMDQSLDEPTRHQASKDFKKDIKVHIDAISKKYVASIETADQAILFLPAEAIFAEINAYHPGIIDYAHSKSVTIASPTTLLSLLSTIQVVLNNIERNKYADQIHEELNKLAAEFGRYQTRWNKLSSKIKTMNKDIDDIHTTTEKISKRFDQISRVELNKNQELSVPSSNEYLE